MKKSLFYSVMAVSLILLMSVPGVQAQSNESKTVNLVGTTWRIVQNLTGSTSSGRTLYFNKNLTFESRNSSGATFNSGKYRVIDNNTFVMGIGVISMSMLFTPLITRLGYYIADRIMGKHEHEGGLPFEDIGGETKGRVILGGYGRVGHVVAILLNASNVPFIVFDNDPARVARGKEDGFPVYYGDIANPELLAADLRREGFEVIAPKNGEKWTI